MGGCVGGGVNYQEKTEQNQVEVGWKVFRLLHDSQLEQKIL